MERDSQGNEKLFYSVPKTLRKGKQNKFNYLISKYDKTLPQGEQIMSRWKECFEDILNIEKRSAENEEDYRNSVIENGSYEP